MNIEEVAQETPEAIVKLPVDTDKGLDLAAVTDFVTKRGFEVRLLLSLPLILAH